MTTESKWISVTENPTHGRGYYPAELDDDEGDTFRGFLFFDGQCWHDEKALQCEDRWTAQFFLDEVFEEKEDARDRADQG